MQSPQTPPAPEGAAPQGGGGGPISELVMGISDGMEKLMTVLPDEDKQGLAAILQGYQQFISGTLGNAPAKAQPMPVQSAPEAGPNARPVV